MVLRGSRKAVGFMPLQVRILHPPPMLGAQRRISYERAVSILSAHNDSRLLRSWVIVASSAPCGLIVKFGKMRYLY